MNRLFLNSNSNEDENRGENNSKNKKKFDFGLYKKNTIKSLNDVEYFLNNFNKVIRYLKVYKLISPKH